ncbi:MAG: ATP-binding cassette domain-containing protein [Pseudomonadota bacterium]
MSAELDKAHLVRGDRAILNTATGTCVQGRFTALCGPNGAGKTTALRIMTGSLDPDNGRALLGGEDIRHIQKTTLARRRAVVSQSSVLSFPFLVHEVVTMGRSPHFGTPGQKRDDLIVEDAMAAMEIDNLATRNYLTLSGGERKRVDIARALAQVWDQPDTGHARWLFLDEPTSALDLKHQIALMERLSALAKQGWGVVAVLHDLHLVHEHADDVWLFKNGEIIAKGDARNVLTETSVQTTFDLAAPYALT